MPLTDAQELYVRQNSGDNSTTPKLSDDDLDAIYDDANQGNSDLNRTVYFAVRRLYALAVAKFTHLTSPVTGLSVARSPEFDNYERLLKLWGDVTGLGMSGVTLGHAFTNTYRTDSLQTEEPTYSRTDDE